MNADCAGILYAPDGFAGNPGEQTSGNRTALRMTSLRPDTVTSESCDDEHTLGEAFDAAVAAHRDEVLHYLRKRLRDRETAADLTQETFSRMMKYRHASDIKDRRLMMFRIANNLVIEYHRARRRHHQADHVSLVDTIPLQAEQPSLEAITDARRAVDILLKRTIVELPPKCRLAFMLSRFDGLTYPQIADRMGISVKMVEKHITRALVACRAAVGDRDF